MRKRERSVERDIVAFCGEKFLHELINTCPSVKLEGVISGLFLTGCRVSEFIQLTKDNVNLDLHPELIIMEEVPVIKRYSRKEKKRYKAYRTFCFRRDEPLVPSFLRYIRSVKSHKLYDYSRVRIYQMVRYVGKLLDKPVPFSRIHSSQLYPHWFRAQRARYLRYRYGFDDELIRDWFGWKYTKEGMPAVYGKYSWVDFAKRMGIEIKY